MKSYKLKSLSRCFLVLLIFSLILIPFYQNSNLCSQIKKKIIKEPVYYINGYQRNIAGEILDYHSCHPEAKSSLLIRSLNSKDYIEWETDTIPSDFKSDFINFVWIAGYSIGSSFADHKFYLFVNNKEYFIFETRRKSPESDWILKKDNGAELNFRFVKKDQFDDFFGYMILRVPFNELKNLKTLKLKVTGDASGKPDYYMTFRYQTKPNLRIAPIAAIVKDKKGKLSQPVRIRIDHFNSPQKVEIISEDITSPVLLNFGNNEFVFNYKPVDKPTQKLIEIKIGKVIKNYNFTLNPVRNFSVYLLSHSHVDIGYTAKQTDVEKLQWKNIEYAMDLSKKTANYPEGARFKWNVEVLWAVDGYLENASPDKRKQFIEAVRNGRLGLDGLYGNELTGLCRPEELFRLVDYSNKLEKECDVKIESAMISDVPGYSWGMVPALASNGIKYFSIGPNPSDRIGYTLKAWGDKPFYWKSPSGNQKILFWMSSQGYAWFHGWRLSQSDGSPLLEYISKLDSIAYPYDIIQLRYTIGGDNGYPDSLLSDFVKNWNEKYESPKFKISTTAEMFHDFALKYGDKIPVYSGDFTPYWEDGAASSAYETALNRQTAENLVQSEILWSILNPKSYPAKDYYEAWKNTLLYSEHTWGAWNSISEPESKFVKDQWNGKRSYALTADSISKNLYSDLSKEFSNESNRIEYFQVFNTSSWGRTDLVVIPKEWKIPDDLVIDNKGKEIPTQRLLSGDLVFIAKDVPALGSSRFYFKNKKEHLGGEVKIDRNILSNKFYKITINDTTGSIDTLLRIGERINYVDRGIGKVIGIGKEKAEVMNTGLNEYIYTGKNAENPRVNAKPKITIKENGPVLASLMIESGAPGCKKLSREVRLFSELDRIDLINTIDKEKVFDKENVRFAFPFNIKNEKVRLDLSWAVIQPEIDQLNGANKNYYTIQRWADASNDITGVTLAVPDAPLLEIGEMTGESWMSNPDRSWLKKAITSPVFYSWVMNNSWHTNYKAEQEGKTSFRYSINIHGKFDYYKAYQFGSEQSQPLIVLPSSAGKQDVSSLFNIDSLSTVVMTALKPGLDGKSLIMRLYNPTSSTSKTSLLWRKGYNPSCFISNPEEITGEPCNGVLEFKRFEIMTIKVLF